MKDGNEDKSPNDRLEQARTHLQNILDIVVSCIYKFQCTYPVFLVDELFGITRQHFSEETRQALILMKQCRCLRPVAQSTGCMNDWQARATIIIIFLCGYFFEMVASASPCNSGYVLRRHPETAYCSAVGSGCF